jgi:hypothetical protein
MGAATSGYALHRERGENRTGKSACATQRDAGKNDDYEEDDLQWIDFLRRGFEFFARASSAKHWRG